MVSTSLDNDYYAYLFIYKGYRKVCLTILGLVSSYLCLKLCSLNFYVVKQIYKHFKTYNKDLIDLCIMDEMHICYQNI